MLGAASLGAAGSLSTVSSFVNELRLLSPFNSARYALVALLVGQAQDTHSPGLGTGVPQWLQGLSPKSHEISWD